MKFYEEDEMRSLRTRFEERVLAWPNVVTKKMFGCPCYQANGKLFAFLVTKGIVITESSQLEREKLYRQHRASAFQAGKRIVQNWPKVPVKSPDELDRVLPLVKKSYERALSRSQKT